MVDSLHQALNQLPPHRAEQFVRVWIQLAGSSRQSAVIIVSNSGWNYKIQYWLSQDAIVFPEQRDMFTVGLFLSLGPGR